MSKAPAYGMSEDRERLAAVRRKLAALFTEDDLDECHSALMGVVRNPDSRQIVPAAALIFSIVQEADVDAKAASGGANVKVLVVNTPDIQRLGELQRQAQIAERGGR